MLLNWLNDYLSKRRHHVVGCYISTPRICVNDLSDVVKHGTVNPAVLCRCAGVRFSPERSTVVPTHRLRVAITSVHKVLGILMTSVSSI